MKGSLKNLGLADAVSRIGRGGLTGILSVQGKTSAISAHFLGGSLVRSETGTQTHEEALLSMLLEAEAGVREGLEAAMRTHAAGGTSLADALLDEQALSAKELGTFLHLQTTDTLLDAFLWTNGSWTFEDDADGLKASGLDPIPVDSLLSEGRRRADEWPIIGGRVSDPGQCYRKRRPIDEDAGETGMGPTEILVYTLIREDRPLARLQWLSRLGHFETCRAIYQLLDAGFVGPVQMSANEEPGAVQAKWAARSGRLTHAAATLVLLLIGLGSALLMLRRHLDQRRTAGLTAVIQTDDTLQARISRNQEARIRAAIAVYRLHTGALPDDLSQAVDAGVLREDDLRFPLHQDPYHYRRRGDGDFDLLRPIR